jgi:hypothetical protein
VGSLKKQTVLKTEDRRKRTIIFNDHILFLFYCALICFSFIRFYLFVYVFILFSCTSYLFVFVCIYIYFTLFQFT